MIRKKHESSLLEVFSDVGSTPTASTISKLFSVNKLTLGTEIWPVLYSILYSSCPVLTHFGDQSKLSLKWEARCFPSTPITPKTALRRQTVAPLQLPQNGSGDRMTASSFVRAQRPGFGAKPSSAATRWRIQPPPSLQKLPAIPCATRTCAGIEASLSLPPIYNCGTRGRWPSIGIRARMLAVRSRFKRAVAQPGPSAAIVTM
jgi:hypothetical protein